MAVSSYDHLLSQVTSLKAENSHLKKELKENSCQLTKLETEASCMKDALTQIQTSMQEEEAAAATETTSMATSLDQNSNAGGFSPLTSPLSPNALRMPKVQGPSSLHSSAASLTSDDPATATASTAASAAVAAPTTAPTSPSPLRLLQENLARMQELERERVLLLTDQENEEKLKAWYYTQLQSLKQHIDQLPITENYSLQTDMARRQLEYEARQLREVMQQRLGAAEDMGDRHEARMQRLCLIEREMQRLQQKRERLERDVQDTSIHSGNKDNHNAATNEPNANDIRHTGSPKPARPNPDAKSKDPSAAGYGHPLPNGLTPAAVGLVAAAAAAVTAKGSTESDSPYAHLSADGTVQQIGSGEGQGGGSGCGNGPSIPPTMLHGTWPYVGGAMAIHQRQVIRNASAANASSSSSEQETSSVMSFSSSACSSSLGRRLQPGQLGAKVEMVYSLLSMLGTHDRDDMSRTLLAMSSSQDSCIAMRQSGCLPLLIQLLHGPDKDSLLGDTRGSKEARARAAASLHNIVHSHPEERCRKQEARVLRLLEQIRAYCDSLRDADGEEASKASAVDTNPGPAMAALMKLSFDEEHRSAICQLGGLHAIADLLQVDCESNCHSPDQYSVTVRRYAGMALTNLTFGDAANKALLCSMKGCMRALVTQLASDNEDLRQVAASVVRNLSWRADLASKKILREVGAVVGLMKCALEVKKESTLKSTLSALWNLSAHFTENKADICGVEGALEFLVATLTYKSPSRTWAVVENGGGILRNISSHVATNEAYRQVLRDHHCLQVLLRHLKSSSLTIVSNACGTLWNLSARNRHDQDLLWELGAVSMLKNLVHSKHKMIAMGSSAALRNLMSARPDLLTSSESHKEGQPTLHVRKQRALEAEIDKNLRETYVGAERECHSGPRRMPGRGQHRSPQSSADYSPVPQRIAIWNPQQSPTHELVLGQHLRERSHSPTARQVGQPSHAREQDPRKLSSASGGCRAPGPDTDQSRPDEGSQHSSGTGSLDSNHRRQTGTSRIAQVMQEVAMHAGIDVSAGQQEPHGILDQQQPQQQQQQQHQQQQQEHGDREVVSSNDHPAAESANTHHHPPGHAYSGSGAGGSFGSYEGSARRSSTDSLHSVNSDIYPMGAHAKLPPAPAPIDHSHSVDGALNMDSHRRHKALFQRVNHEDMGANMDSTINFSLKYSDESLTPATGSRSGPREEPYQGTKGLDCGHYKGTDKGDACQASGHENQPQPVVLCQECNTPHMQREGMAVGHAFVPPQAPADRLHSAYPAAGYSEPPAIQRKLLPLADPCSMDLRGGSGSDGSDEKPVDYSRHNLPHSGHLRSRFNEDDHEHYASDQPTDFSQRYQTDLPEAAPEGINFVQTSLATGTTGNIFMNTSEKSEPATSGLTEANLALNGVGEGQTDLLRSDSVDTAVSACSTHTTISRAHDDKQQMYCVEDTPVVFSRCSSLSSLDSSEADRRPDCEEGDATRLQESFEVSAKDGEESGLDGTQSRDESLTNPPAGDMGQVGEQLESGLQTPASLNQIQDTPLIFSRCSSVSSLSSFEVQSICDDRSSCYSDSRRASEVVSPSDLPDSPSQTMPPSPRRGRKRIPPPQPSSCDPDTVGLLPECEENLVTYATEGTPADFSCATSLSGLTIDDDERAVAASQIEGGEGNLRFADTKDNKDARKEAEVESGEISEREQNMLDECINSAMPPKKSTLMPRPSRIAKSRNPVNARPIKSPQQNGKHVSFSQQVCSQEAPNPYATEDTPINFSTATSLSDLSIEDIDIQTTGEGRLKVANPLESGGMTSAGAQGTGEKQPPKAAPGESEAKSESSSVADDAEDSMLEECINSGMPKPRLNKLRSSQLPPGKHRPAKGLSKMRSPKPSGLPRRRLPSAGVRHKSPSPIPEMAPEYQAASSSQERVQQWQNGFGGPADSVRTFCTEGTPQQFSTATSLSGLSIDSHNPEDVLNGNITGEADEESAEMKREPASTSSSHMDSPKQYAVEGTPMSFSRNDSLSSLSCEDDMDSPREKPRLKGKPPRQQASASPTPSKLPMPAHSASKLPQPSSKIAQLKKRSDNKPAVGRARQNHLDQGPPHRQSPSSQSMSNASSQFDSPQVFTLEGTPMSFSRNDSLSSLSCEEDADLHNDKASLRKSRKPQSGIPAPAKLGYQSKLASQATKSEHSHLPKPVSRGNRSESKGPVEPAPESAAEVPVKFAVEDTPVCFSRNSSLSSLSDSDGEDGGKEKESPNADPPRASVFAVEDTPICFSRNSSLSSLSVESLDGETSASEQALLDECISSAMPRSQGKKAHRRHRRSNGETAEAEKHRPDTDSRPERDSQLSPLSPFEDASADFSMMPEGDLEEGREEEEEKEEKPRKGPRITKPGESGPAAQPNTEKGVRGGRKTYKSPISNTSRSVAVPKSTQPNKTTASKPGLTKQPSGLTSKTASGRTTTPSQSGSSTPNRGSAPVKGSATAKAEVGSTTAKPPPINTDTFTKKKNLPGSSATSRSAGSQPPKPASASGTATRSLANKQATSKVATGAGKTSQPAKDSSGRSTPASRSALSSQRNSPATSRNTSPSSPAIRSPRGSISGTSPRTTPAAKSSSLSPARSPMSSRTSSPSPHTTAATRKSLTKTTPTRNSGPGSSPSTKSGLPSSSLSPRTTGTTGVSGRSSSPRNSVSSAPGRSSSPRNSVSATPGRSTSPRNSVSGTSSSRSTSPRNSVSGPGTRTTPARGTMSSPGSKNTSPRSSISETSARSMSPRNSISGIQTRSASPRSKTTTPRASLKKVTGVPASDEKKPGGSAAKPKSSNVFRLDVGSQRPTLVRETVETAAEERPAFVKQSTFTKESASLPEQTPENTMGVESESEKPIEEAEEEEEEALDNEVFALEEKEANAPLRGEAMLSPPTPSAGWRRISVESDSSHSASSHSGSSKTGHSSKASATPKTTVASGAAKTEQSAGKPTWNSSVTAPKNWGRGRGKEGSSPNSRSSSPASVNSRSQSPLTSASRSQSPSASRGRGSRGTTQKTRPEQVSEANWGTAKALEKPRDLCKELDIPVKNYGGNVTSPVSDSNDDSVWVKREEKSGPPPPPVRNNSKTISRQNSSTVSLQSQTSHSGSARSLKSNNSTATSSSSSASKAAPKPGKPSKSAPAAKPAKEAGEKKTEKKKFSFLKLKMKGKKAEAGEDGKQRGKADKSHKSEPEEEVVEEKVVSPDPFQMLSPESDVTSSENDLEPINLDQQLDALGMWDSDDNIDNEVMPDEFVEWDSEADIFKEELPDEYLLESGSDITSSLTSPDSPCKGAYQIGTGNRTDDSPSPEFKQFRLENRLNSFIRMDCPENDSDANSTGSAPALGEARTCRSKSVPDAGSTTFTDGGQSPPRPQRLRLPKKPFGINRSDSSPTTAIPVLVSPFNYSPSKRSQSEPHSPDTAHRRPPAQHSNSFHESREQRQRLDQYKRQQRRQQQRQQQQRQEEIVCSSEDSDLISPTLSSRVTTV